MTLAISWSSLQRWEECRQKHRLYMARRIGSVDGRVFLPGTVVDRAMRAWLNQDDPQPGGMAELVPDLFEYFTSSTAEKQVTWRHRIDREVTLNLCIEGANMLEPILYDLVLPYEYQPEIRFKDVPMFIPYINGMTTARINLIGGIDIGVRRGDGSEHLYDLKMAKSADYVRKTLGQAFFYDLAWKLWRGDHPDTFAFVFPLLPRGQQVVNINISEDDRREIVRRVQRMAHGMWLKDWQPKETNDGCARCEARHACEKYIGLIEDKGDGKRRMSLV